MIEIESPAERSARRGRKAVVVAAAAALIAGTAGFLAGRATEHRSTGVGAVPPTVASTTPALGTEAAPATTAPPAVQEADATVSGPLPSGVQSASGSAPAFGGSALYMPNAFEEQQMELLAERTTASGVVLRAHLTRYPPGSYNPGGPPGWAPAGWCYPQGDLRVSVAAPQSVNVVHGSWFDGVRDGLSVMTFASGYVEGFPIFGAAAEVDADVVSVTMTTGSGLTDTTSPSNSIALLEVDGPIEQDITFTITKADGTSATRAVGDLVQPFSSPEYHSDCDPPPPTLPPAGEQPADPAAAAAAVRATWATVHDFTGDPQARSSLLDDANGVADAWKALQEGDYADAAAKATADIAELVFTSPTEAWFRYDLLTPITNFYDRYGIAHLRDDGVWVITRQTVCQDIQLAPGYGCTPTVDTLLPPSAASDPRYAPQPVETTGIVGD